MTTWGSALQQAALTCAVVGFASACAVLMRSCNPRLAVGVLLDFLLAAGLLRLSDDPQPRTIMAAAIIILIRKLASIGLARRIAS